MFRYGHAEALAREIPGARLLPLDGIGHQMPPPQTWKAVIPALVVHTCGGGDAQNKLAGGPVTGHPLTRGCR